MVKAPPVPSSLTDTFLVCGGSALDFFCDEFLALYCLLPDSLLDGPRMRTDGKVVLNHFPGNTGDIRRLPRKHVDIRPQESNERAFLFGVKSGADGEGTTSAALLDRKSVV